MLADEQVQFKGNIPTELASFLNLNLIELRDKLSQSSSLPDKAKVEMVNGEIRIILPAGNFKLMGADGILNNIFDNSGTNLSSTNIQNAVVEVNEKVTQTDNAVSSLGNTVSSIQNQVNNLPPPSLSITHHVFDFVGDNVTTVFTFTHNKNTPNFKGFFYAKATIIVEDIVHDFIIEHDVQFMTNPDDPANKVDAYFEAPPLATDYRVILLVFS